LPMDETSLGVSAIKPPVLGLGSGVSHPSKNRNT
jgi:hypothetical protein